MDHFVWWPPSLISSHGWVRLLLLLLLCAMAVTATLWLRCSKTASCRRCVCVLVPPSTSPLPSLCPVSAVQGIVATAGMTAMVAFGVNVQPLLTFGSISTVAVGFAAQSTMQNVVSALQIVSWITATCLAMLCMLHRAVLCSTKSW